MAQNVKIASCYVHQNVKVDTRLLHKHHKHPQGYGGTDDPDNLVWLCGSCHDVLHRLAYMINNGKSGPARDLAAQYQDMQNLSPAGRHRLLDLSSTVAAAMRGALYTPEVSPDLVEETERKIIVSLHLPAKLHGALKAEASKYTNPVSGRRMGLYRYIERVLHNHVAVASNSPAAREDPRKFYAVENPSKEEEAVDDAPLITRMREIE